MPMYTAITSARFRLTPQAMISEVTPSTADSV